MWTITYRPRCIPISWQASLHTNHPHNFVAVNYVLVYVCLSISGLGLAKPPKFLADIFQ